MLTKKIFITFMALTAAQYFHFAASQNKNIITYQGLIICAASDSIPQDVVFIPSKSEIIDLEAFAIDCLSSREYTPYFIYFQGIRHIQPSVRDVLQSIPYIQATTSKPHVLLSPSIRLFRGKISFYKTNDLDIKDTTRKYEFDVMLGNMRYDLLVIDRPLELGVPEYFQKF